ncbi:major facilitator superfamily domain-containing protein [Lipomyces arxii]|uniref:major facilitator superfamily domain-containing protein n=1 Tax=Lipomyces arxii TaxID=56418 RepID=UPI0034CE10C3
MAKDDVVIEIEPGAVSTVMLEPADSRVLKVLETDLAVIEKSVGKARRREAIGVLHKVCVFNELENPHEYGKKSKLLMVYVYAFAGCVPAMGSAVIYPTVHDIAAYFRTDLSVINLSIGFYMFSLGVFPLWWSYLSEIQGRRAVYLYSFVLFVGFSIGCALSNSIGMLIAFRILAGGAAASSQSVGAGAIGDIYTPSERGRANSYFYLGPLVGPMITPIIAGALNDRWGWRAPQYFLTILGFMALLQIMVLLPETLVRKPIDPSAQEKKDKRKESNRTKYYVSEGYQFFIEPFKAFKLLKYPSFLFAISYNSFGYGGLYIFNNTIDLYFVRPPYSFSSLITGIMYFPNGLGYVLGSIAGGRWADRIIKKALKENNGVLVPEARLGVNMVFAGVLVCGGMLIFGWALEKGVFWFVPLVGTFVFGFGSLIIFTATLTYLVDSMPNQRSGAVSINTFIRCMTAAVGTFVTVPIENGIGAGWMFTILSCIGVVFFALQIYVKKKGPEWRARSMASMETG